MRTTSPAMPARRAFGWRLRLRGGGGRISFPDLSGDSILPSCCSITFSWHLLWAECSCLDFNRAEVCDMENDLTTFFYVMNLTVRFVLSNWPNGPSFSSSKELLGTSPFEGGDLTM